MGKLQKYFGYQLSRNLKNQNPLLQKLQLQQCPRQWLIFRPTVARQYQQGAIM